MHEEPIDITYNIYRNGKNVLVLAGKGAPKIVKDDRILRND